MRQSYRSRNRLAQTNVSLQPATGAVMEDADHVAAGLALCDQACGPRLSNSLPSGLLAIGSGSLRIVIAREG